MIMYWRRICIVGIVLAAGLGYIGCDYLEYRKLPVKFLVCGAFAEGCHLIARFEDFRSCEFHKKFSDSACIETAMPSLILCDTNGFPPVCEEQLQDGKIVCEKIRIHKVPSGESRCTY